jgi:ankyrin repeat protein
MQDELYNAIINTRLHTVLSLLRNGADANAMHNGKSLLYAAVESGEDLIVRLLIDYGADVNVSNPLHLAIMEENIYMVHLLIENGANINASTDDGSRARRLAYDVGNPEIYNYIYQHNDEETRQQQLAIQQQQERQQGIQGNLLEDSFFSPSEDFNESGQLNPEPLKVVELPYIEKVKSFAWPGMCQICTDSDPVNLCLIDCDVGHIFHCDCINTWRNTKTAYGWNNKCPVCRNNPISTIAHITPEITLPSSFGKKSIKKLNSDIAFLLKLK